MLCWQLAGKKYVYLFIGKLYFISGDVYYFISSIKDVF